MPDPKKVALVNQLLQRTLQGKISWEATLDEGVYQANFPGYTLRIFFRETVFIIQIYNEEGMLIEEFTDESDSLKGAVFPGAKGPYTAMQNIYSAARRTSLGVDKAIDSILSELGRE